MATVDPRGANSTAANTVDRKGPLKRPNVHLIFKTRLRRVKYSTRRIFTCSFFGGLWVFDLIQLQKGKYALLKCSEAKKQGFCSFIHFDGRVAALAYSGVEAVASMRPTVDSQKKATDDGIAIVQISRKAAAKPRRSVKYHFETTEKTTAVASRRLDGKGWLRIAARRRDAS